MDPKRTLLVTSVDTFRVVVWIKVSTEVSDVVGPGNLQALMCLGIRHDVNRISGVIGGWETSGPEGSWVIVLLRL
jgi:hypothetical protein